MRSNVIIRVSSFLLGATLLVAPSFAVILELPMDDITYAMSPSAIEIDDTVYLMACVGYYSLPGDPTIGFEALRVWTIKEDLITWTDISRTNGTDGGLCESCLGSMAMIDGHLVVVAVETIVREPGNYNSRIAGISTYQATDAGWIQLGWEYHSDPECWGSTDPDCFPMHPAITVNPITGEVYVYVEEDYQIRYTTKVPGPLNGSLLEDVYLPDGVHQMIEDVVSEWYEYAPPWNEWLGGGEVVFRALASEGAPPLLRAQSMYYGTATFHILSSNDGLEWIDESTISNYVWGDGPDNLRPTSYGDGLWGHSPAFLRTENDSWDKPWGVLWTGTRDGGPPPPGYSVVLKATVPEDHILSRLSVIPSYRVYHIPYAPRPIKRRVYEP